MKDTHFYALLSRMKYINRWGLMRNAKNENLSEHSLEVAFISHALAIIHNKLVDEKVFNNRIDEKHLAILGMYHDATEIITGDMPTPIKYHNKAIKEAYNSVENIATNSLLLSMPEEFRKSFEDIFYFDNLDEDYQILLKAADKISAYIKCLEEFYSGNKDFICAKDTILQSLLNMKRKEVDYFLEHFIPSYGKTLDELIDLEE